MNLMNRILHVAAVLGLVAASLAVGIQDSAAGLGLRIDYGNNGSYETTTQDNGAGDSAPLQLGQIIRSDANGLVTLTTNTGLSKPVVGSTTNPVINLLSTIATSGATELRLQLSDTDFSGDPIAVGRLVSIGGTLTSAAGSYVTTNIYRDLANTQFGTGGGTLICSTGPLYPEISGAFAGGCGNLILPDDAYSVTIETIIHLTAAGIVSYDAQVGPPSLNTIFNNSVTVFPGGDGGTWPQFRDQYLLSFYPPQFFKLTEPPFLDNGYGAKFIPNLGLTLSQAANSLGFDHFNWLQKILETGENDPTGTCNEGVDQLMSGTERTGCPNGPNRDSLDWYLDEQFSISGVRIFDDHWNRLIPACTGCPDLWNTLIRREQWTKDDRTLLFSDSPRNIPDTHFLTCLVGVRANKTGDVFDLPGSNTNHTCFRWVHLAEGTNVVGGFEESGGPSDGVSLFLGFVESEYVRSELLPLLAKDGIGITSPDGPISPVQLDVEPRDLLNRIQPGNKGVTTVAILTTDIFDATSVDPLTVRFGPNEAREVHARGHIEDVNRDGKRDLVLHFDTRAAGIQCGNTSVILTGQTYDERAVRGYDRIRTVGCK